MKVEKSKMALAFLDGKTLDKAKELWSSPNDKIPIEIDGITYRLYKSSRNVICFEHLVMYTYEDFKELYDPKLGNHLKAGYKNFFNPIGFYSFKIENAEIEATLLYKHEEFIDDFLSTDENIKLNKLSFIENALIGAFSAEALINIARNRECSFTANGLDYYIVIADDGDPQVFLDIKYPIKEDNCMSICVLQQNRKIFPNAEHGETFNKIRPLNVFSMHRFV